MSDTWIFGYGSLIWRPSLPFTEQRAAYVTGWARRFWQGSPDHRGTPEAPGRVATLLRWPGKGTWGRAYRVPEAAMDGVLAGLDHREKAGYERQAVELRSAPDEPRPWAVGLTWVAPVSNPNYLGLASPEDMAAQMQTARGESGSNREYALRLADALRGLNEAAADPHVRAVEAALVALGEPPE